LEFNTPNVGAKALDVPHVVQLMYND